MFLEETGMRAYLFVIVAVCCLVAMNGCRKSEEPKVPTTTQPGSTRTVEAPVTTEPPLSGSGGSLSPADDKDDPQFGLLFPASRKAGDWVKTEPVRGDPFKALAEFLPNLAEYLAPFAGEVIATATYQRTAQGKIETAKVHIIRAKNADDAYGMMSVSSPGADVYRGGQVWRRPAAGQIRVAKGTYFGLFDGPADGLDVLAEKMFFELADQAEVPMVVQLLQTERLPVKTTVFVRNLKSLQGPAGQDILKAVGLETFDKMNKLLRLGPNVDLAIALYTDPDWLGADVVWLAQYPTNNQALEVARRYRQVLNKPRLTDPLDRNTLLKGPLKRFLLGTWTMETESMAHLMNQIQGSLP